MDTWPCCFGACGEIALYGGHVCQRQSIPGEKKVNILQLPFQVHPE